MAMLFPRPQTQFSKEECEEFHLAILPQTPPSSLRTIAARLREAALRPAGQKNDYAPVGVGWCNGRRFRNCYFLNGAFTDYFERLELRHNDKPVLRSQYMMISRAAMELRCVSSLAPEHCLYKFCSFRRSSRISLPTSGQVCGRST